MSTEHSTAEMISLKERLKNTWSAGDFGQIARSYEKGATEFVSRMQPQTGQNVLDIACGTGNLAFAATKYGARVVGVDIAANLIAQARTRAEHENHDIVFEEGDAENLRYADSSFDLVVTMFGAMFAPRPELVVSEMLRVTRRDGTIAMANWTPTSFVGEMFKVIGSFVPPPKIMPSPLLWGDDETVRNRFGNQVQSIKFEKRLIAFEFDLTPDKVVAFWRQYYGPTQRAFDALNDEPQKQEKLQEALETLWMGSNAAQGSGTLVESEYLEVVVTR